MRFGFHISISGGFSRVIEQAELRGCETIQLFSRNPRGWSYPSMDEDDVNAFRLGVKEKSLFPVFLHLPYLPNIGSFKSRFYKRSIESIIKDLERAEILGAQYLIIHIGHRLESSEEEAIEAVAYGINQALRKVQNSIILLMENTSGQGTEIGYSFSQIKKIIELIEEKERIGVCLDTAHAFEAGYDLSNRDGIENTLESFDSLIGLNRLHLIHLNDSKTPLGSRKDRHWHIGEGYIGIDGFSYIINHPKLQKVPGIMETPRSDTEEDLRNMRVIRSLIKSTSDL